jgi:hypothetical protein
MRIVYNPETGESGFSFTDRGEVRFTRPQDIAGESRRASGQDPRQTDSSYSPFSISGEGSDRGEARYVI